MFLIAYPSFLWYSADCEISVPPKNAIPVFLRELHFSIGVGIKNCKSANKVLSMGQHPCYTEKKGKGGRKLYLEGTPGDRIGDIRTNLGLSKKDLSKLTGIDPSQITRIENGDLKTISSDYLIRLSKALKVSTDYILGLTKISVQKSYDISELGLSEGAVRALVLEKADITTLNRLLEHKSFPQMINLIRDYFDDSRLPGTLAWNEIISMATATMEDYRREHPEKADEIKQDIRELNTRKLRNYEAEIERIKSIFISILKDIKKDIDDGTAPTGTIAKDVWLEIQEQLAATADRKPTKDELAAAVASIVSQRTGINGGGSKLVEKLMKLLVNGTEEN